MLASCTHGAHSGWWPCTPLHKRRADSSHFISAFRFPRCSSALGSLASCLLHAQTRHAPPPTPPPPHASAAAVGGLPPGAWRRREEADINSAGGGNVAGAHKLSAVWAGQLWTGVPPGATVSQRLGLCLLAPGLYQIGLQRWHCAPAGATGALAQQQLLQQQQRKKGRSKVQPPLARRSDAEEAHRVRRAEGDTSDK